MTRDRALRRLDPARAARQVGLLLGRGGRGAGGVGELVDDDEALVGILRQDAPGRPRAARSARSGDSAGRTGAWVSVSRRFWPPSAADELGPRLVDGRRDRHRRRRPRRPGTVAAGTSPCRTRRRATTRRASASDRRPGRRPAPPSSGRPVERPAAHQVEVEVVDRLAAPAPDVRHEPVAAVGDPGVRASSGGDREQPPEQRRRRPRSGRPPTRCAVAG